MIQHMLILCLSFYWLKLIVLIMLNIILYTL